MVFIFHSHTQLADNFVKNLAAEQWICDSIARDQLERPLRFWIIKMQEEN